MTSACCCGCCAPISASPHNSAAAKAVRRVHRILDQQPSGPAPSRQERRQHVTIEGLAGATSFTHPGSFLKHHAFQCGYCTSGMLLNAYALLLKTPSPRARSSHTWRIPLPLRRALRIVEAIQEAAGCAKGGAL